MVYGALVAGSTGTIVFGWKIWTPDVVAHSGVVRNDLWGEVRRVGLEVQELSTAVLAGKPAEVNVSASGLVARAWAEPSRDAVTVVVANLARGPTVFDVSVAAGSAAISAAALFEGVPRTVETATGGSGMVAMRKEVIDGWGTRVYRLTAAGNAGSGAGIAAGRNAKSECF